MQVNSIQVKKEDIEEVLQDQPWEKLTPLAQEQVKTAALQRMLQEKEAECEALRRELAALKGDGNGDGLEATKNPSRSQG